MAALTGAAQLTAPGALTFVTVIRSENAPDVGSVLATYRNQCQTILRNGDEPNGGAPYQLTLGSVHQKKFHLGNGS